MKWAKMQGPASKRSYVYDHWLPHRLSRDYEATESASARCSVKAFTGVGTGVVVDMNEDMFVVDLSSNATWQQRCSCAFPACHHKACEHMCCLQSAFGSGHAVSGSCMVTVSFRRIRMCSTTRTLPVLLRLCVSQDGINEEDFFEPRMLSRHLRACYTSDVRSVVYVPMTNLAPDDCQVPAWIKEPVPNPTHSAFEFFDGTPRRVR